jgi:negative regulator of sigma-B (phosphoserine phosphatase)
VRTAGGFSRPYQGLSVCGDSFVVAESDVAVLVAVIDGLGHGFESAVAAERAVEVIQAHADQPVGDILSLCHKELRATRGAALGLLKVAADGRGEFCGIGNIDVHALVGRPPGLFCIAGIVGHNVRTVRVMPFTMQPGDVYGLLSDGVSTRGDFRSCLPGAPREVARRIVERWGKAHDDATALVLGFDSADLAEAPGAPVAGTH